MAYNKNLYTSADSALDASIIYDQNLMEMQDEINADIKNGDIVVGLADNLASSYNQYSTGEFIERTTGGTASLSDGEGHLVLIRGRSTHTGYTAPSAVLTVTNAARGEEEEEITATIEVGTFLSQMGSTSGTFTFSYTSSWNYNPASYGITVIGTPKSGDSIAVSYQKEVRGTITQSNPQTFVSTGWNLYDHSKGYARALYYMNNCRFGITGTYTAVQLSSTLTGSRSSVTPDANGTFGLPSDFDAYYIWVTGGNDTDTAVWMCWTDWTTQANGGIWEAYSESEIDVSTIMSTYFPNGLLNVGSFADEIDLSLKTATNNVGRLAYSAENLATVQALGTEYEYDENYIYYGLGTPVVNIIDLDNIYAAYDHGIEFFTETIIPVYAQTLYGVNLKNRLERDVVLKSGDTMTGDLVFNPDVKLQMNTTMSTATPSKSEFPSVMRLLDSGGTLFGVIAGANSNDGRRGIDIESARNGVFNSLRLYIDGSGNRSVALSAPDAWLTALGLGTVTSETNKANIITAASGFTIVSASFYKWGKVGMLNATVKKTTAQTSDASMEIGTVVVGKRPRVMAAVGFNSSTVKFGTLGYGGALACYGQWAANAEKIVTSTYILA